MAGVARHLFSGACRLDLLTAGGGAERSYGCGKNTTRALRIPLAKTKTWLNSQLEDAHWNPIKCLKTPSQSRLVRLEPPSAVSNLTGMDSNAEIFATHLEQAQWAPPAIEGVDDIDTDLF